MRPTTPAGNAVAVSRNIGVHHAFLSISNVMRPTIRWNEYPRIPRIVCLTEETTETLYRLGAGDRVVGVSGYTARPPEARQKPRVSAFINARFDKIEALDPDLVLAFSDLQADIAAELSAAATRWSTFNQRSVAEILQMIRILGGLVGLQATRRSAGRRARLRPRRDSRVSSRFPARPRVYFEEWDDPLISGIRGSRRSLRSRAATPLFPALRARARSRRTASSSATPRATATRT